MIPFQRSLFSLAVLWSVGLFLGFTVVYLQSVTNLFGTSYTEAWQWFLPNILPTLGAVFAAVVAEQRSAETDKEVSRSLFWLAFAVSLFYLLVLLTTLVVTYVRLPSSSTPLDWLLGSSVYIGPLQGLAAGLVGYFYVRGS